MGYQESYIFTKDSSFKKLLTVVNSFEKTFNYYGAFVGGIVKIGESMTTNSEWTSDKFVFEDQKEFIHIYGDRSAQRQTNFNIILNEILPNEDIKIFIIPVESIRYSNYGEREAYLFQYTPWEEVNIDLFNEDGS